MSISPEVFEFCNGTVTGNVSQTESKSRVEGYHQRLYCAESRKSCQLGYRQRPDKRKISKRPSCKQKATNHPSTTYINSSRLIFT
uniref:Uncharacterized protein n=1 Tax=Megaselia scalaris TaxID=36166 RepID=T1GHY0_MEGSC